MEKITEWLKSHPTLAGAGVLVVGLILLLLRGKSTGSSSVASTSIAASAQVAAAQAASNTATAQVQAQLQAAGLQAQVQQSQINAAASVANTQTAAQLAASLYNTQQGTAVTTQANTLQAQTLNNEINATVQVQQNNNAAKLSALNTEFGYASTVANNQYNVATSTIGNINGSQNRTAIALGFLGDTSGSVAAENGQTQSSANGNALVTSLAGTFTNALVGLFG